MPPLWYGGYHLSHLGLIASQPVHRNITVNYTLIYWCLIHDTVYMHFLYFRKLSAFLSSSKAPSWVPSCFIVYLFLTVCSLTGHMSHVSHITLLTQSINRDWRMIRICLLTVAAAEKRRVIWNAFKACHHDIDVSGITGCSVRGISFSIFPDRCLDKKIR